MKRLTLSTHSAHGTRTTQAQWLEITWFTTLGYNIYNRKGFSMAISSQVEINIYIIVRSENNVFIL